MKGKYYLNRFINSQNNKQVPSVHLDKERYVYTPAFIAKKNPKNSHCVSSGYRRF